MRRTIFDDGDESDIEIQPSLSGSSDESSDQGYPKCKTPYPTVHQERVSYPSPSQKRMKQNDFYEPYNNNLPTPPPQLHRPIQISLERRESVHPTVFHQKIMREDEPSGYSSGDQRDWEYRSEMPWGHYGK
ncbi:hypothetical protein GPJ56_001719 [Histomonas meleagridis]|uniref:uncharacterized protein n=1 Tax=Histomonas meleagridis TaxID=135588 RepID=UPI003559A54B|nr:hypothetical protein GPJ56_001719 [Histomonas meleagridis]KAH0796195.1 hypothetical protein GO595_010088 [Histomonas meleagridis]